MKTTKRPKRPHSGRPEKPDKDQWRQITTRLRIETIEALRQSCTPPGSARQAVYFGKYLQWHLQNWPPLSYAQWQAAIQPQKPVVKFTSWKRGWLQKELEKALLLDNGAKRRRP
jgi:hypothetical protein